MKNRVLKWIGVFAPVAVSVGTLALYLTLSAINSSQKNFGNLPDDDQDGLDIYDRFDIFPHLDSYRFYDQLRIIKGKAIIDEQMIAKIINYVLDNSQISGGGIYYNYERKSDDEVIFTFKWSFNKKTYYKSYHFQLLNNLIGYN